MKSILKTMLFVGWMLSSCTSLDTNQVKKAEHRVKGGATGNLDWKDELVFKRTSWYYQASLLYEINVAPIDPQSPFMNWFDQGELSNLKDCKQILWVIDYAYDNRRVQRNYVKNVLSTNGFVDISVPHFEKNFINHPDTTYLSNRNYKMQLFCHHSSVLTEIFATIPGFKEEKVELQ